jgi:hypothetical protein
VRRRSRSCVAGVQPKFRELLTLLERHGVRFIVIGGAAMVLQGASYITQDMGVLYERSEENIERLAAVLKSVSPRLRVEGVAGGMDMALDAAAIRNGMNFTLATRLGDLDIFGEVLGLGSYEDAIGAADAFELVTGSATRVLTPSQLVAAKRAAGRPKDLVAIPELEAIIDLRSRELE